jgi:serine/threonine protein kinase
MKIMKVKMNLLSFFVVIVFVFISSTIWVGQVNCNHRKTDFLISQLLEHTRSENPREYYIIGKEIGRGRSVVFECTQISSGRKFAIKKVAMNRDLNIQYAINEIEITKEHLTGGSHFVQYHDSFYYKGNSWMVVDLIQGKTLNRVNARRLSTNTIIKIVYELLRGLEFLQKHNICHSDLLERNVMIDYQDNIFIVDFGAAKLIQDRFLHYVDHSDRFRYKKNCNDLFKFHRMMRQIIINKVGNKKGLLRDLLSKLRLLQRGKISIEKVLELRIFSKDFQTRHIKTRNILHKRYKRSDPATIANDNYEKNESPNMNTKLYELDVALEEKDLSEVVPSLSTTKNVTVYDENSADKDDDASSPTLV